MGLTCGEMEVQRMALGVAKKMNLCGKPTTRTA